MVLASFTEVNYKPMAIDDFKKVIAVFEQTPQYHLKQVQRRYSNGELLRETLAENLRYNNFYYASHDSVFSLNTLTKSLGVDLREKVMTYKYGYHKANEERANAMLASVVSTIEQAVSIDYEEIDLERGKYTLWVLQGNTWKIEYTLNKVNHRLEEARFYNHYPEYDFDEEVLISYSLKTGKIRLNDRKYDFDYYIREHSTGVEPADNFSDFNLQSLNLKTK